MANVQITQLPNAGPLTGTEAVPIVQSGITVQTTTANIAGAPTQIAQFLEVSLSGTTPNARYLAVGSGLTTTDAGAGSSFTISLTGALPDINTIANGIVVKTGPTQLSSRLIAAGTVGLSVSDGDGVAGNPTINLTGLPLSLAQLSGAGMLSYNGSVINPRTITGTAGDIFVANGNGSSGDPTISLINTGVTPGSYTNANITVDAKGRISLASNGSDIVGVTSVSGTANQITVINPTTTAIVGLASNPIIPGAGSITIPVGTTGDRPSGSVGQIRYNTTTSNYEAYNGSTWSSFGANGVLSFSAGSTGLTPNSPTAGSVVLGGTLNVSHGGTGANTLTGYVYGNGTSAMTASPTIPTTDLSGTISNVQLANSSLTIGTTTIGLGSTSLTLDGLTYVALTQDPANALDAATKQYVDAAVSNTNYHAACNYATTADLGTVNYNNGSSGVGATITKTAPFSTLSIDSSSPTTTQRILVKNQSSGAQNGIYTVTNVGSGSTAWILTRASDYDQVGTGTNEVAPGDITYILSGFVNTNTQWVQTTDFPIVLGTTPLVFTQISSPGSYTAGNGLSLVGTQFSLIAPVSVANGGTGQTSALTPGGVIYGVDASTMGSTAAGTAGYVLLSGGAASPTWASVSSIIDLSSPPPIGNVTPNTGAFTSVTTPSVTATTTNLNFYPVSTGNVIVNQSSGGAYGLVLAQDTSTLQNSARLFFDSNVNVASIRNNAGAGLAISTGATIGSTSGAIQFQVSPTASAVNYVQVTGAATVGEPTVLATGSDAAVPLGLVTKGGGAINFRNNGIGSGIMFQASFTASSVNYLTVTGSGAAGNAPRLFAQGTDTNISMAFQPKGTGAIDLAAGSSGVNISNGGTVTAVTRVSSGANYTSFPTVAVSAPTTAGGVQAVLAITMAAQSGTAVTPANGGTGYTLNDTLTVVGGTGTAAQFIVTGVSAGVVTQVTRSNSVFGTYTALPTSPATTTGGTGTGCTLNMLYEVLPATITTAGSGYIEQPTVTFSGGGGSSASAYATVGSIPFIRSLAGSAGSSGSLAFYTPAGESVRIADVGATAAGYVQLQGASSTSGGSYVTSSFQNLYLSASGAQQIGFFTNGQGVNRQFNIIDAASAVNYVQATGAPTTRSPSFIATGSDTNISLNLVSKGTNSINLSSIGTSTNTVNIGSGQTVTSITTINSGQYTVMPTSITFSAPQLAGGTTATFSTLLANRISGETISAGGTGYTNGDTVTVVGGTGGTPIVYTVTAAGGVVSAVTYVSGGLYTTIPTNPASVTGGTGTGLQITIRYQVNTSINSPGSGYLEQPTITVTGGTGTAFSAYAKVGGDVTIRSIGGAINFRSPNGGTNQFKILDGTSSTPSTTWWQVQGSNANPVLEANSGGNAAYIQTFSTGSLTFRTNGSTQYNIVNTTSAVNFRNTTGGATGKATIDSVAGSDTNISLGITTKGTGAINLAPGTGGINISNGQTVTSITRTNQGSGYTTITGFTWSASAPVTTGGVTATGTVTSLGGVSTTLVSGGTGYTVGDVLTVSGGTFSSASTITVNTVSGGVITGVTLTNGGIYTVIPSNPVSVTGGSGSGATFTISYGVVGLAIGTAGSGYIEQPTVTFSGGGAGAGAAAYATVGSGTIVRSIGSTMSIHTPGGEQVRFGDTYVPGTSANYWTLQGRAAGTQPAFGVAGSDTNISAQYNTKGTGSFVFYTNSGAQQQFVISHTASAVNYVQVTGAATGNRATISAQGSDAAVGLNYATKSSGSHAFYTATNNLQVAISHVTNPVNYIDLRGSIAGSAPVISTAGSDTNIDLALTPKGTGRVRFGTYTATVTAVSGYIEIVDSGGTIRKLAVLT